MKQLRLVYFFSALIAACLLLHSCDNSNPTDNSAAEAAAQLGLGGDDLGQVSAKLNVMDAGAQIGVWTSDYPAAQKLAQEKELPLLLFFNGSDWSMASNTFIQNVLLNQEWLDFQPNLVLVYLDFPRHNPKFPAELKEQNNQLRIQYGIRDFPSMILCTNEGQLAGNLHANTQSLAHDIVRNVKLFRRRIPSEIDKLIAQIDDPAVRENYATFKATGEARQKLLDEVQGKMKEMDETMMRLGTQLEEDIANWIIAQRPPEEQAAYQTATQARKSAEDALTAFMQGNPSRTPENQQKFQELQAAIQRQQLIIDEIIAK
ncbi:MAG: thioredoxin family protein [Victivallales bacterium]|nr:thioredoxin family protein [Victivallales bacterium]